jgi:hypothetical protein
MRRRGGGSNPAKPSEDLANNTLSTPGPRAFPTLSAGRVVAGSAGTGGVGHSRKEEADAKVPAWLSNRALHRLAGTDFPDEPIVLPRAFPAT